MKGVVTTWLAQDEEKLVRLYSYYQTQYNKWETIGKEIGKTSNQCRSHWRLHKERLTKRLNASPYPRYDQPLVMETDKALVLPDPEFPFHHAEFINRVLDLSQAWGIESCIIAGDMLHFDSLSSWQPNWTIQEGRGGLDENQERLFIEFIKTLGKRQQEKGFDLLEQIGLKGEDGEPNVSEELRISRKAIKILSECFKNVDVVIGNHEGRLLRQLNSPLFPNEIIRLIEAQYFRIAPFYYSVLWSNNIKYFIEHPKSAAECTAERLCAKFQCNVICAHSHITKFTWDMSGLFYAITTGCCVDEARLPYASQRHTNARAHSLGATIVRDGYPYLLYPSIDWKRMEKMA